MSGLADLLWAGDALVTRASGSGEGARADDVVLVSDSFLVDDGRVLALDVHRDRFLASVEGIDSGRLDEARAFWVAAVERLPLEGRWFPRLRLAAPGADARPDFALAIRPAPASSTSVVLSTAAHDPRVEPRTKGPDLARLETLRAGARAVGADEAVILSPAGLVVEGNYTSLVWWRGDALCVVDDEASRLPGVTERALVTLATALGVEILRDETDPDGLDGLEVWALNSLHGARIATRWIDGPNLAEHPGRLRTWRTRLDALRRPVR